MTEANGPRLAKAGTLLSFENGEYSSYQVYGFFVVLHDFAPITEREEYEAARKSKSEPYAFDGQDFLATIIAKGLLLEIPYGVIHDDHYESVMTFRPIGATQDEEDDLPRPKYEPPLDGGGSFGATGMPGP